MLDNVVTFLPTFMESKSWSGGVVPDEHNIAFILSMFSVAQIIFSPLNSAVKNYLGSKNTIILGFIIMTISTFGLGLIASVENANAFFYLACALRFL